MPARLTRGAAGVLLFICWATAHAIVIAPVIVEITPERRVASITVTNPDDALINFQTQVLAWTQIDGVVQYIETDQLIVVPPIAAIAAGGAKCSG